MFVYDGHNDDIYIFKPLMFNNKYVVLLFSVCLFVLFSEINFGNSTSEGFIAIAMKSNWPLIIDCSFQLQCFGRFGQRQDDIEEEVEGRRHFLAV